MYYYRTSISRLFRVLAWMGREHFFMMQYAMLITLHIPKWKNCFFKKKGPNTIDYTECIFLRYI